jgi:hypothetical protein
MARKRLEEKNLHERLQEKWLGSDYEPEGE